MDNEYPQERTDHKHRVPDELAASNAAVGIVFIADVTRFGESLFNNWHRDPQVYPPGGECRRQLWGGGIHGLIVDRLIIDYASPTEREAGKRAGGNERDEQ